MLSVLKNNYCRMAKRLPATLIMTLVMIASIVLAVYVTSAQQIKGHVVLVTGQSTSSVNSKSLSVTVMKKEPPYSDLVKQKYDAYIIDKGNGKYHIKTLRSNDFKTMLQGILKNPKMIVPQQKTDRGIGVNIVGFLITFMLTEAFMNLFTFADDKEQGQLTRIVTTPVSIVGYIAANCIYCLSMFLPAYLTIVVIKIAGFDVGFSLLQYALLLFIIGMLGISFALLLNMFFKKPDNASMFGNATVILTSIMAGSFYSFSKGNKILDYIIKVLPQKQLLDFAQCIQNKDSMSHLLHLWYIAAFIIVLLAISCYKLRVEYVKRV